MSLSNPSPPDSQPSAVTRAPLGTIGLPWAAILSIALCATLAGLVWLGLSSRLAATGRDIAELESHRQHLLERRVTALVQHASATNPRRLAERAASMGFAPLATDAVERLAVADPSALEITGTGPSSPLAIARRAGAHADHSAEPADLSSVLMSLGAAMPASADELAADDDQGR